MLALCRPTRTLQRRVCQAYVSGMASSVSPKNSMLPVSACFAVSRQGTVCLDPGQKASILEQPPYTHSRMRALVLNRQSSLNALNQEMLETLHTRISLLNDSEIVDALILTAAPGRAFCAGGDIRALYDAGGNADYKAIEDYFRAEYKLDWLLGSLKDTTLISVLDGIVMGGGAGISMHGRFRIATENTVFAMPECGIGLFPDVGMSYLLTRLKGGTGPYLALSGARLKGTEVLTAGLATHYIPSHMMPDLMARLHATNSGSSSQIARVLSEFAELASTSKLPNQAIIDECFADSDGSISNLTVESILERLRAVSEKSEPGSNTKLFANSAIDMLSKGCPVSVKICLEALKRARQMTSLSECLQMDFRLAVRCARLPNFLAGVKSAIITKDKTPVWNPKTVREVRDEDVQSYFAPLISDLKIPELNLDDAEIRSRL